jgi:hypothetical protein
MTGSCLFNSLGVEAGEQVIFRGIADLDGIAAHFTILDIDLPGNGKIQDHGDLFAAVGAHEVVFHCGSIRQKFARGGEILRSCSSPRMRIVIESSLHFDLK